MSLKNTIDPFTVEIIKRALISAAEQMFVALGRTARSSVIYEVLDYGCALTDAKGRMIAQANGIPAFIGVLGDAVRDVRGKFGLDGLEEGDILMTNDPYMGGATHQNDAVLILPIFQESRPVMFAASKAHWNDVGGKDPGSWSPDATDIYQEGLQFPVVKIFSRGEECRDVVDILARNSRIPDMTLGDMRAQAASLRVAARRVRQICGKYSLDAVLEAIEIYLEQGRQEALTELSRLPKGEYTGEEFIDDDGLIRELGCAQKYGQRAVDRPAAGLSRPRVVDHEVLVRDRHLHLDENRLAAETVVTTVARSSLTTTPSTPPPGEV